MSRFYFKSLCLDEYSLDVLPEPKTGDLSMIYDTWYEGEIAGNTFKVTAKDLHLTKAKMVGYEDEIIRILTDAGVKNVERKEVH